MRIDLIQTSTDFSHLGIDLVVLSVDGIVSGIVVRKSFSLQDESVVLFEQAVEFSIQSTSFGFRRFNLPSWRAPSVEETAEKTETTTQRFLIPDQSGCVLFVFLAVRRGRSPDEDRKYPYAHVGAASKGISLA